MSVLCPSDIPLILCPQLDENSAVMGWSITEEPFNETGVYSTRNIFRSFSFESLTKTPCRLFMLTRKLSKLFIIGPLRSDRLLVDSPHRGSLTVSMSRRHHDSAITERIYPVGTSLDMHSLQLNPLKILIRIVYVYIDIIALLYGKMITKLMLWNFINIVFILSVINNRFPDSSIYLVTRFIKSKR